VVSVCQPRAICDKLNILFILWIPVANIIERDTVFVRFCESILLLFHHFSGMPAVAGYTHPRPAVAGYTHPRPAVAGYTHPRPSPR